MTATGTAVRPSQLDPSVAARLKRDRDGLVVAVTQQHDTGEVLMVGWMDDEALHRTLTSGRCTYWSRSRQEYWVKGETSGAQQWVRSVALDCDGDTLLVRVDQAGSGACHTGDRTCFDAVVLDAVVGRPDGEDAGDAAPEEAEIGQDTPAADPDAASPS
jgi:phosphoribosyl-AMP cyclohydrolase